MARGELQVPHEVSSDHLRLPAPRGTRGAGGRSAAIDRVLAARPEAAARGPEAAAKEAKMRRILEMVQATEGVIRGRALHG